MSEEQDETQRAGELLRRTPGFHVDPKATPDYSRRAPSRSRLASRPQSQEFFEAAVNAAWLSSLRGKGVSAPAICSEDSRLPLSAVRDLLDTPRFRDAMAERGLQDADRTYLSREQVAALTVVADPSLPFTERQRVEKLGISWREYQGWMDYAPFRKRYRELQRKALDIGVDQADRVLAEKMAAGDLNSIKYVYEMTGKYVPGSQQQASVGYVLGMVLSVLQRHITDPGLLMKIAGEMGQLASSAGVSAPVVMDATVVEDSLDPLHNSGSEPESSDSGFGGAAQSGDGQREPGEAGRS